ncbi:phosphoribosylaminoimidazole-succinocarboxamide synthase [Heyndrickxia shackletonii]|uniref:Phosphoribosylaminoimidazole-succinocarboxamide synthase n=1 Tax=Heyndrickxia shackletonii TaxID=157838 RepID=A0A0Q3WT33_9BACI|nr:phosphoribosylaminoimidazolesuccinocarboxamide synthase [Heyndrickxia shackletonii]KQL51407.1 phosphoribosylaminoimidazole-succinocarboxamide synthase [Heyndrickxia shackletonii]MBB2479978.1 phosphoribosylaminoimidazolesuccinocarboxamide synthase [Bacillus sp. APMAM]NEZ00753.1 phosphoribosylaminoimidazolesuccinocarboxamide synthase [Heyndrickxia shackletonii]RTZ56514.1 phosphoribosylaminoimidazolesuccinocarboxamide synthase [Bacillus sp. SAJ1]
MEKNELLYEGKAKRIYATDETGVLWVEYKDSATAFNGVKKSEITGKGILNNEISSLIFANLQEMGIESHFIRKISETEQLVKQVSIIPLEVVTRNVIAGSLAKRLGIEEGTPLKKPVVEFYYKNDDLGDPLITEDHIGILEIASLEEVNLLRNKALKINEVLSDLFLQLGIRLVDFKLEFGKDANGEILLADEISPDTCRLWDVNTNEKLDKDVFRRDLGDLTTVYTEILNRLKGETAHV